MPSKMDMIGFGSGTNKKCWMKNRSITVPEWMTFSACGQDGWSYSGGTTKEPHRRIAIVTDGHGHLGEQWSYVCNIRVHQAIADNWWELKAILRKKKNLNRIQDATTFIKNMCRRVESSVTDIPDGGTTLTASLVMIVGRERYVIQFAVGDSPGGIYANGKSCPTVLEANCDNRQSVQAYYDRCLENGVEPKQIIINRINYGQTGLAPIEWPIGSGQYKPIPAWKYGDEVVSNFDGYEAVRPFACYGTQSRNYPEVYLRNTGEWSVVPGHEVDNFGNSILTVSNGQNLTGFGDLSVGIDCDCDASVNITIMNTPGMVYSFSDGVGDLFKYDTICQFVNDVGPTISMTNFVTWANDRLNGEPDAAAYQFKNGRPNHDDMAMVGLVLGNWR